jgi:DNA polymerase-1
MSLNRDKTLLLIDCFALIHRAYHAFPPSLQLPDGTQVNAVYGFTSLLLEVLAKFEPSHVVAVFDAPGPTVRHQDFGQYKAHREKPDDDFVVQLPLVQEVLKAFDIPLLSVSGFEADDVIGTIDKRHSGKWAQTIIVTGDKDLFQLVDDDTFVYLAGSSFSQSKLYDREGVKEKIGVLPEYVIDLKSLQGDPSDNIPGVRGIGPKSAIELIDMYGHLDEILKNIDEIPSKHKQKIVNDQEMAQLSRKLATIITDVPVSFDFEGDAKFGTFDPSDLERLLTHFQFNSLRGKLVKLIEKYGVEKKTDGAVLTLFSTPAKELKTWEGSLGGKNVYMYPLIEKEGTL